MSGSLKRKFEEGPAPFLSLPCSEDDDVSRGDSGNSSDSPNPINPPAPLELSPLQPRPKHLRGRNVQFDQVTVYYFSRRQGFTSVPTQGGSTLGMSPHHSRVRQFTLREFAVEQERSHRDMLREHLKEEKLNIIKLKLTGNGASPSVEAEALTLDDVSEDDLDVDNTEVDEYFYLQPLTTRRRRALLRASGVRRIDGEEKRELRALRVSREECGCHCRGGACDPETCVCSLAGIQCQVDRMSFPCGCTKEGCGNRTGRLEFNPVRVRTHFLHTIMKLEPERGKLPPVTSGNGYRDDISSSSSAHHQQMSMPMPMPPGLPFPLVNGAPHLPMMHQLQNNDTELQLDDDEGEEEEDDEDEDDEDEDEEDFDDEYFDDEGSSMCSGLSDCSTHSLETDDEDDEEDDEEDEEEEGDGETADAWRCPPPFTHTDVVPLSAALGFTSNGAHVSTYRPTDRSASAHVSMHGPKNSSAQSAEPHVESRLTPGLLNTAPHCQTGRQYTPDPLITSEPPTSKTSLFATPECDTAPAGETGEQQLVIAVQNDLNRSWHTEASGMMRDSQRQMLEQEGSLGHGVVANGFA